MEPDPVFQKALENFKKDLTVQQRHEFDITTLKDVNDEINKIQIQHGSAKKLRGMSRMSKFLEAMQQLEQVISVFLNVSEVVAFIWGPIKFFLVVASSRLEILECLLDTFTDISEAMPDLQSYVSIFKDQPEVLEVLERCYGDIIQFYHMAFGVLGRPGAFGIRDWRRIFDSVWKTFRTKFSPVLGSLRRHRELLVQVKLTATYGAVETTRRALQESIEKSNEELKQILNVIQQKKKQVLEKLGAQGPQSNKGHRRLPDQRYPTSGDWILQDHHFLQWLNPNNVSDDLLYLNGMPGAGKTTLVSRIIDGMTKETNAQQRPLLNFYFEHGQSGKSLMMDMLRSFIEQLLQQDDAIVDDLHESVLPARPHDLISVSWLKEVATRTILAQKRCYIVVDGLDECALDERKNVLQWLETILSKSQASSVVVKVLISGQRDGVIDAGLPDCVSAIRLDDQSSHLRDITNFSTSVLIQIKSRFPGLEDEKEILRRLDPLSIANASKGMFMYAKVVLDNFLSQTSIFELGQELEREYPDGLEEAYNRVAERVLEKSPKPRQQAALQILGLITCAARPLKWREIQCYFCIDPVNGTCDSRRSKVGGPKDLCSSFVESKACTSFPTLPSEAQLIMVHNTAKSYLIRSSWLDIVQQHMRMSLFCFRYLTRPAFDTVGHDRKTVGTAALTGFYGLFDYAAAHWDHHSLQYVRQASKRDPTLSTQEGLGEPLSRSWMDFARKFSARQESPIQESGGSDVPLDVSKSQAVPPDILDIQGGSCNIQEIFRDWTLTRRSVEFENLAADIRQTLRQTELCALEDREKTVYTSLNGPFRPKCSRRACVRFNAGFDSEGDLLLHISQHEMAFKCPHAGCYAWLAGFSTGALLQRHLKRVHQPSDSEERLFPTKPRSRPPTLEAACRLGDIELMRSFPVPMSTNADMLAANRALEVAAKAGHMAICVHLTQKGANPYKRTNGVTFGITFNVIQALIRLGDLDLFLALRGSAREGYEIAFIEDPGASALVDCILDALESPIPRFLVDLLACNGRRGVPFTLDHILSRASVETWRQKFGHRTLSHIKRRVPIEHRNVQQGLQTLILTESERYRERGHPPGICYEKVFIAPDSNGDTLLHRLCGSRLEQHSSEVVRFLLTKLRPQDIRRHDSKGIPPLFTAMENRYRPHGTTLNITRTFFENNLDEAKNTRDAAGRGPLEFAFRYGPIEVFPLVFKLCGADYNAAQLSDIFAIRPVDGHEKMNLAFGLGRSDKRISIAVGLTPGEMRRFICLLEDLNSEPEVVKMLNSLLYLPQAASAKLVDDVPTLSDMLQSLDPAPTRFLSSLKEADRLLERCRPEVDALAPVQLRRLLFASLGSRETRLHVAKILMSPLKLDSHPTISELDHAVVEKLALLTDTDAEIVGLLIRDGAHEELYSREGQVRHIQTLSHILYDSKQREAQYPNGIRDYVDYIIQYANFKGYHEFAASLNYIRRGFQ